MSHSETTLFLMSGDPEKVLAANALPDATAIEPFSERELVTPKLTLERLRKAKGRIVFGTKVLRLQRYRLVLKVFLFLAGKTKAAFVDETGECENYSLLRFIFVDIWRLVAEIIASGLVVLSAYLELEALKRNTPYRDQAK